MDAEYFRAKARQCAELAARTKNADVAQALRDLADEFEAMADVQARAYGEGWRNDDPS